MTNTLTRIDTIIQFTQGSATPWSDITKPLPIGAVAIDTVNQIVKEGDGVTLWSNLPICLDYNFVGETSGAVTPVAANEGMLAIANNSMYTPSTVKLTDILSTITSLNTAVTAQQAKITTASSSTIVAEVSQGAVDGTIVICQNGQYAPGTETLTQLVANLIASASATGTTMHITDLVWYYDAGMTQPIADQYNVVNNSTYYCKITGWHDTAELRAINFGLNTLTSGITITNEQAPTNPTTELITTAYSTTATDVFNASVVDSTGNIIAAGYSSVGGSQSGLVCKFDQNFNPIARILFSGNFSETINGVTVDSTGNIVCVGSFNTAAGGNNYAFIVVFNSTLTSVVAQKAIGGTGDQMFYDVCCNTNSSYVAVGYTTSQGAGARDCLIVSFNSADLSVASQKVYGGTANDVLNSVVSSGSGNVIAVGSTASEGVNQSGLIIEFNSSLSILTRKYYNSTLGTSTTFEGVCITAAGLPYCAGIIVTATGDKGLMVAFDSNLNVTADSLYGSAAGSTDLTSVTIDSTGDVVFAGRTNAEGSGGWDALVIKLNSNLSALIGRKVYGSVGTDADVSVNCTSTNDIILAGYAVIDGTTDALLTKLPASLPTGAYTNKYFVDLALNDSVLNLTSDSSSLVISATTLTPSTLPTANGTMTMSVANGSVVADITLINAVANTFKIVIGDVATTAAVPVTFTAVCNDGNTTTSKALNVSVNATGASSGLLPEALISGGEPLYAVAVDSTGHIYCVGLDACIIMMDSAFNILDQRSFGYQFNDVAVSPAGNLYCVGSTVNVSGFGSTCNAIIMEISGVVSAGNLGGPKTVQTYGNSASNGDSFSAIAIDSSNNVYAVGTASSYAVIVKYLNGELSTGTMSSVVCGAGVYPFEDEFTDVGVDSSGNIFCIGTATDTHSDQFVIVKFDTNLNILYQKSCSDGTLDEGILLAIAPNNDVFCFGLSMMFGYKGMLVKFDNSLNFLAATTFGPSMNDWQEYDITCDSLGNVYWAGYTDAEYLYTSIIKFDTNLNITASKRFSGNASFSGLTTDASDNVYCTGYDNTTGKSGGYIFQFPGEISSGSFVGTTLTTIVMSDFTFTQAPLTPTIATGSLASIPLSQAAATTLTASNVSINTTITSLTVIKDLFVADNVQMVIVDSIGVFSDAGCTLPVTTIYGSTTYYAKVISSGGGGQSGNSYTLTNVNNLLTPVAVGGGVFSLSTPTFSGNGNFILTATAAFGTDVSGQASVEVEYATGSAIPMSISSVGVFSDAACTLQVTTIYGSSKYYVKIVPTGGGGTPATDGYSLFCPTNDAILIISIGGGIFQMNTPGFIDNGFVVLNATASPPNGSQTVASSINVNYSDVLNGFASPTPTIAGVGIFSDAGCAVVATNLSNSTTYYAKIVVGGGGSQTTDTYTLTSNNPNVSTVAVGNGVFQVNVGIVAAGTLTLTASATYEGNSVNDNASATLVG